MPVNNNCERPVFFDPDRKRWPRLRRSVFLSGLAFSLLFGLLIVSILLNPELPVLGLPQSSMLPNGGHPQLPKIDPVNPTGGPKLREAKRKLYAERKKHKVAPPPQVKRVPTPDLLTMGFYVNWDPTSMSSLQENIANLDVVITECLELIGADGTLEEPDHDRQQQAIEFIRSKGPDVRIMALVNNFNSKEKKWDADTLKKMLANPEARKYCIAQLSDYAREENFAGISLDFENVLDESQPALTQFTAELATSLHSAGLELSISLPANNDSFEYRRISETADYVILMAYDQHYAGSNPGPIAGADWFEQMLRLRQTEIPASKTIVAIANYAYDWEGTKEPVVKTFQEAVVTAKESSTEDSQIEIRLDPASLNPTFRYEEDDASLHQVWMLDAVTAFNQMAVTRQFGARGVALWRLGSEDPSMWNFFGKDLPQDASAAALLSTMSYGYGLDYETPRGRGEVGEILHVKGKPGTGTREIGFDSARGLITSEHFTEFPSSWLISRYGGGIAGKIALTFDDGPDPEYTPHILDALKQANAHATFFVTGLNGEQYPGLLKRMIEEGHDIGNHTFTHPNIAKISKTQLQLELSATSVLLESVIGRRSYLFRPPYAEDSEPDTPDEVGPLETINDMGYLTVGMQIDPKDWHQPGVEKIVSETLKLAQEHKGNIVLLHDSGGERSQTVAALPELISKLRENGFQLVTVSELLGKTRDEVMPPISPENRWRAWAGWVAFGTINLTLAAIHILFLAGIVLGIARLLFIGVLATIEHYGSRHRTYPSGFIPSVAIIVPAFNEEKVIVQTIASLLAAEHESKCEIVVVDDGSTDGTSDRVRAAFAGDDRVRLYTRPNGGKAAALSFGVAHTDAEIVIALDADTVFTRNTITKLVRHFTDPRIGAVAGNAKVGNRINLLTRWQALEYITSQNLDRRAFDVLNCVTVVPGAVGAWRRELVEKAGGFSDLTLAEDADLTMSIRKLGYSIVYEDEAVGLTEAPDTVRGFIRQRYRWMYGTLQAAWKHKDALFRPRYGSLGFVALPNIFLFQVIFPLVSPAMDLLMLVSLATAAFNRWQHPTEFSADTLWRVLFYYAMFVAVDFAAAALAFVFEPTENKRLLVWLLLQRFFYRQLMYYVAIKSTLASLRGVAVEWNKLERKATVRA